MSTSDRHALNLLGEQAKDTAPTAPVQARLQTYLRGLPSLDFSDKGRAHVCQRFGVEAVELAATVAALMARRSQSTPAPLRTIATVVSQHASGGEGAC